MHIKPVSPSRHRPYNRLKSPSQRIFCQSAEVSHSEIGHRDVGNYCFDVITVRKGDVTATDIAGNALLVTE